MKKHTLLLVILSSLFSWSQSKIETKNIKVKQEYFTYLTPVFSHDNRNASKIVYDRFEDISQTTLDSLFNADSKKYLITEKIDYKTSNDYNLVEKEIKQLFKSAKKKSFRFNLSKKLKSIINRSNNNYIVFTSINTRGRYPSEIGPAIYETGLKYLIIDLKNNNLLFYGKSNNSETINGGYQMAIIKNLKKIYKKIKKAEINYTYK